MARKTNSNSPMFQQRHYEFIAATLNKRLNALRNYRDEAHKSRNYLSAFEYDTQICAIKAMQCSFAIALEDENPNFKPIAFYKACNE